MKHNVSFYIGVLLAFGLLYVSFSWQPIEFWVLFPISLFLLTIWSWLLEKHDLSLPSINQSLVAVGSGILLYGLFALGKWLLIVTGLTFLSELESLYKLVKPTMAVHYLWLFLIIIPGEEWFWRGFIVKRLLKRLSRSQAILYGTLMYAGAHLATGSLLLVLAALIGGFIWSLIYVRTQSIWVPIVSHLIFNLFLLVIFPLL